MGKLCVLCQIDDLSDHLYIDVVNEVEEIIHQHFSIQIKSGNRYILSNNKCICTECLSVTLSFHKLYKIVQQNVVKLISSELKGDEECHILYENNEEILNNDADKEEDNDYVGDNDNSVDNQEYLLDKKPIYDIDYQDNTIERLEDENIDVKNVENYQIVDEDLNNEHAFLDDINNKQSNGDGDDLLLQNAETDKDLNNVCYLDGDGADNDDDDNKYDENNLNEKKTIEKYNLKSIKSLKSIRINRIFETDEENQQIKKFFKMSCDLCCCNFKTFSIARTHYAEIHKRTGYLVCCNKKYFLLSGILDHINRHLNPDAYTCFECNKIFLDSVQQKMHITDFHIPVDQRKFKCDICHSSFAMKYRLSQHMQLKHCPANERQFKCTKCESSFITKNTLTQHIKAVHLANLLICHICAKTFKTKHYFALHVREHTFGIEKQQCKICDAWLKNKNCLSKHMARHTEDKVTCKICNRVTLNKNSYRSHMIDVHGTRKHKCTFCEYAFTTPCGLKRHLITHTGEKPYSCLHCPLKFKSRGVLKSHVQRSHPGIIKSK